MLQNDLVIHKCICFGQGMYAMISSRQEPNITVSYEVSFSSGLKKIHRSTAKHQGVLRENHGRMGHRSGQAEEMEDTARRPRLTKLEP